MKAVKKYRKEIRLTAEEKKKLEQGAEKYGVNTSEYLRMLINNRPGDYPEYRKLIAQLINEINHIGNNINQIARSNNAGFYSANDKNTLFHEMKWIRKKIQETIRELGNK